MHDFYRAAVVFIAILTSATAWGRSVFLNGIDISPAKSQELKNVNIVINERGDIFIIAPHYQVNEEDSYVPLSRFVQGLTGPQHKAPQEMGAEAKPLKFKQGQFQKAGDPAPRIEDGTKPAKPPQSGKGEMDEKGGAESKAQAESTTSSG